MELGMKFMTFLRTLTDIYNANFPIRVYILKDKDIKFSWIKDYASSFLRLRRLKMIQNLQKYVRKTKKKS